MSKIAIKMEIDIEELMFLYVPPIYKNLEIKNFGYMGVWLVSNHRIAQFNNWRIDLPSGYRYEILGFVDDVIIGGEIPTDKNFVLRKIKF